MNYEKERYVWKTVKNDNFSYACIYDSEDGCNLYTNELVLSRLNQQDKRIKELEEENKVGDFWRSAYKGKQLEYDQVYAELRNVYEENQQLKEENGYIIFSDGYDENDNPIHKQEFVKYKDKCSELIKENKKLKQSQKQLAINELLKLKSYFVEECLDGDDITTGDTIFTKDAVEIALQINNQIKELGR